jgi:hypothetical protein
MRRWRVALANAAIAATLGLATSCMGSDGPEAPTPATPTVSVPFFAQFPAFVVPISTVVITVTGPGIAPALVFNLPIVSGSATGTLTLPVGGNRTLVVQAFDATGVVAYSGTTTVNVAPGVNAAVTVTLNPLTGSVPVTATVGNVTLTLAPATATMRAGTTTTLTASLVDGTGATVTSPITWASSRPPGAYASPAGVVTALDTGVTVIAASALGAGGQSTITVTPGTTFRGVALSPATIAAAGGVITASVTGTDAGTGLDSTRVTLRSPSAATITCLSTSPATGTRTSGTFTCALTVPSGAATGDWTVDRVQLFWTLSATARVTDLSPPMLSARGVTQVLTVTP